MKLIFLGPQGSGKSTQAKILAEKLDLPQIEMGQLFRDKQSENSEEGLLIKDALDTGKLVPDEIAVKTLKERVAKPDCQKGYILDGYPRNLAQLEGLEKDIDRVFYVRVSDEEAVNRLLKRSRGDDTEEIIRTRLEIYHDLTEPLLEFFKNKGILKEVDGERPIVEIAKDIAAVF